MVFLVMGAVAAFCGFATLVSLAVVVIEALGSPLAAPRERRRFPLDLDLAASDDGPRP